MSVMALENAMTTKFSAKVRHFPLKCKLDFAKVAFKDEEFSWKGVFALKKAFFWAFLQQRN